MHNQVIFIIKIQKEFTYHAKLDFIAPTFSPCNPCARNQCVYGSCLNVSCNAVCQCDTGYTGYYCQSRIDPSGISTLKCYSRLKNKSKT